MFPPSLWALSGTPWASLTMPETSRRELSNEVNFGEHPLWAKVAFESERRPGEIHQGYVKRKHLRSFFEAATQKTPKQWIRDAKQRGLGNFDGQDR